MSGLEGTSDNVGRMNTRNATPEDEFLPGEEFRDPNGHGFAQFVTSCGFDGHELGRWHVRRIESTGSTNDDLVQAAERGAPDRVVLIADHQTAGRGRLDRRWEAPPATNLLMSVLFRSVPDRPHRLTQAVALAATAACRTVGRSRGREIDVSLKWPNDILIGGRKLAGILAAASVSRRQRSAGDADTSVPEYFPEHVSGFVPNHVPDYVVVGLGLNVRWAPEGAVSLVDCGADVHRDEVLAALIVALNELMERDDVFERYRAELSTLGRSVRVELPSGDSLDGTALGVGVDGRLEVLDSCAITHHIDVADIVHLRIGDKTN